MYPLKRSLSHPCSLVDPTRRVTFTGSLTNLVFLVDSGLINLQQRYLSLIEVVVRLGSTSIVGWYLIHFELIIFILGYFICVNHNTTTSLPSFPPFAFARPTASAFPHSAQRNKKRDHPPTANCRQCPRNSFKVWQFARSNL